MLKKAQNPVFWKNVTEGTLRYGGDIGVFNFLQVEKKCSAEKYVTFLGDLNYISWEKIP